MMERAAELMGVDTTVTPDLELPATIVREVRNWLVYAADATAA